MIRVTILGATGSIGCSTADVIQRHSDRFSAYALVGHRNSGKMVELAKQLHPRWVVMTDPGAASALKGRLPPDIRLAAGMDAAIELAASTKTDIVMAAMVGSAGIPPTLAAVEAGKRVALANKECLVTAGSLFIEAARRSGAELRPVDSEHAAVHQCLAGHDRSSVRRVILTASGGPFRDRDPDTLAQATLEEALAHPNWEMGAKISVDSATMMNKALELIEARWLFDLHPDQLSAVIHPQSIVHALVEYLDGSMLAQLAMPDMRMPIAYALQSEPRLTTGIDWLDLAAVGQLTFQAVDERRFPAIRMAHHVLRGEASLAIAMNAANEVANEAFRERRIGFMEIIACIEKVLEGFDNIPVASLDEVWELDAKARRMANEVLGA